MQVTNPDGSDRRIILNRRVYREDVIGSIDWQTLVTC